MASTRTSMARAGRSGARALSARGARQYDLDVRAGLHTGEIEIVGDKVGGIAVHIGARVAAQAGAGEVLASSTVKDLVAGSAAEPLDRGCSLTMHGEDSGGPKPFALPCVVWDDPIHVDGPRGSKE